MLKFIRRNAEAAWVKFMFVAIVVVFIFWGMGGIVGSQRVVVVARVNDDAIEPLEYARAYNNLLRVYQDLYKDNFKPEMAKAIGLKERTVDQLIQEALLRQEARRIGLRVGEAELRDAIAALPAFRDDGHFNRELYVRVLRANSLTPGDFEDSERQELLVKKLQTLITSGVHVSEAEVHDRYVFDHEKVSLRFVKVDPADFTSQVTLSDQDVQAYFAKHQDEFREPDRVRIEYVLYPPDAFAEKVHVSDAAVTAYYDAHHADYEKPETVHARHILIKVAPDATAAVKAAAHKRAAEVLAKVKAGGDFAALAKQYSEDAGSAANGGDLGTFSRGKMVKPFEEAAFALAAGQVSDIVESPFGLHIIKVEAKTPAHTETLDAVRPQIVAALRQEQARATARAQAETDRGKAAGGEKLATLAQAAGLSVSAPAPFAKTETVPGIGMSTDLATAAFATDANAVGPVVDTPKGSCVFRVTEKIAAHVPKLTDIRSRVEAALRSEKAAELAKKSAEALLAQLKKKPDLEAAAKMMHLKVEETSPFTRQGTYLPNLGNAPALRKAAFTLSPAQPVAPEVYNAAGNSVVAVLKNRVAADEADFKSQKDTLMHQAAEQRKSQAFEEFLNYLKARAAIEINQDYLAGVTDNGMPLETLPRH